MRVSAIVPSDVTLLSDSNNNEQLFINLATVPSGRNASIPPAQSCTVVRHAASDLTANPCLQVEKFHQFCN